MEQLYPRSLENSITKYLPRKEIIGIRGARQVGKTTLLKGFLSSVSGDQAFISMDLTEHRRALEESPFEFIQRQKRAGQKLTLFLDEIQKVNDAGEKLKIIYDHFPDVKIMVSGSSSLELKTNVLPALVGRLLLFELYTFDLGEYLNVKDQGLWKIYQAKHRSLQAFLAGNSLIEKPAFPQELVKHWKEYVIFGGYPEIAKSNEEEEKKTLLKNIFNLYLEKDIAGFFKIEDTSSFGDFLKALSFTIGNLINLSSLAAKISLPFRKTEEYLHLLQHTYIIHIVKPFHRNVLTEIKKSPKAYFLDLGLRNAVLNNFTAFDNRTDAGQLMENHVCRQLVSHFGDYDLHFWRTTGKAEVDFILTRGEEIIPVEVKLSGKTVGKSFHSFLKVYRPKKAIIVTLDHFAQEQINQTTLFYVPVFYF
ncbi:MAG: ATP-binding protein [Nanoarchaeota archaeon]